MTWVNVDDRERLHQLIGLITSPVAILFCGYESSEYLKSCVLLSLEFISVIEASKIDNIDDLLPYARVIYSATGDVVRVFHFNP